ncbi:cell wall protein precursor, choline binding protein, truncated [Streptococcus criceti]|uniref:YSIRK Gram-positive signal peptide domain-containing protein n=1 Tax=Streptococcus criceti HS-6 TaxID=873449 RepID=G5JRR1_STRCG|nr:YSIRK-type signal peptide-containing protein [Streptococcus criceti]EHI74528.1 hypothetical protein STRCR_0769 [Streptococcus criceti HS-6]SUN43698.1 cell wall protein precursor, choline binding protein, truncated [Streptococcus criceti]
MKRAPIWNERQRFSIRKYSFGAASVLIGASLFFGGQVLADEQAVPAGQPQDQTVQTTIADQPVQDGNSLASQTEDSNTAVLSDKASVSQQASQDSAQATAETSAPTDAVTSTAAAPARVDTATQTDAIPAQVESQSAVQTVSVTSQQNESLAPTQESQL